MAEKGEGQTSAPPATKLDSEHHFGAALLLQTEAEPLMGQNPTRQ